MKNTLRSIRLLISRAIAPSCVSEETDADRAANKKFQQRKQAVLESQYATAAKQREALVGHVSTATLQDFSSDYARNAVSSLGAWSALAKGFSDFVKNPKSESSNKFCNEFHAWNAVATNERQLDDEATLAVIARLSQVQPAKGNKQTDEVIARILKKSLDEVQADREQKAKARTAQREEHILAFNTLLWSSVWSEGEFSLPAQKVMDKLEQTLEWMAGWDSTNPAALASELLLLESDMKLVSTISRQEPADDYIDGVMAADTLTRRTA